MNEIELLAAAAIVHAQDAAADVLLAEYVRDLRARGLLVRGVLNDNAPGAEGCARRMRIVDIEDGTGFLISQSLGSGSTSCCVDPAGVAAASVALRRGLDEDTDLVVANRFGKLEAAGGGFAAEMLALMSSGVPLLTVVADRFLEDWRNFTGNAASELPPRREALEQWLASLPPR